MPTTGRSGKDVCYSKIGNAGVSQEVAAFAKRSTDTDSGAPNTDFASLTKATLSASIAEVDTNYEHIT